MAFTQTELVDIRRFCGYPVFTGNGWMYEVEYNILTIHLANMAPEEETVVRTIYLPILYQLESDIDGSRENLDTAQAAVWTHNPRELADRKALFNSKRRSLCEFMGMRPGGNLAGANSIVRG